MRRRIVIAACLLAVATIGRAQAAAPAANPLSDYLQRSHASLAKDLIAVVEMMPEDAYAFRPAGAGQEVRTFGEIVYHIASTSDFVCAMGEGPSGAAAIGKPNPVADKASLVPLVRRMNDRCAAYFATLTDSILGQSIVTGPPGRQMRAARGNAAIFAIAHTNEHYGNLVSYLRAKGLVPPPTPAQASWLSLVPPG